MKEIAGPDEVTACYRLILGREPDPAGFRTHVAAQMSVDQLVRSLVASPEYRTRARSLKTMELHGRRFLVEVPTLYFEENYEAYVFTPLMSYIQPGVTFLDVGANIGMFSIHAALRGATVIAVEARPSNCSLLLENARRAQVSIELHPLAASDHHGYAVLDMAGNSENAAVRRAESHRSGDQIVALGLLDELVGDRRVDVLKIDVEGYEYRALLGARRILERSHPVMVTEYAPDAQQAASGVSGIEYVRFLRAFGYQVTVLERSGCRTLVAPGEEAQIDALCRRQGYHADLLLEPQPMSQKK